MMVLVPLVQVALKGNIPTALREAVRLDQVQRYFRRAWRFQELYAFEVEKGVVLPAAVREYTMKKYNRHRTVPATLLADVTSDFNAHLKKLRSMASARRGKKTSSKLSRVENVLDELKKLSAAPMEE